MGLSSDASYQGIHIKHAGLIFKEPEKSNPSRCADLTGSGRGVVIVQYSPQMLDVNINGDDHPVVHRSMVCSHWGQHLGRCDSGSADAQLPQVTTEGRIDAIAKSDRLLDQAMTMTTLRR